MRLARWIASQARTMGAQVTLLDLRSLELPLYDADIEAQGLPRGALALRDHFAQSDALIVCSPEYNGFPSPLLINALDWATRAPAAGGAVSGTEALGGTVAGLVSASPGGLGGLRGLVALRSFLQMNLQMLIVPEQYALGSAGEAFDSQGELLGAAPQQGILKVLQSVLSTAAALQQHAAIEAKCK